MTSLTGVTGQRHSSPMTDGGQSTGADVRAAVQRTRAQKTARLMLAWADGPVPEDADILSEGLVDFAPDRVWVRQRNATARMTADGMTADSKVLRLFWRLYGRRWSERYLEGGAIFKRSRKDGTWSESRRGGASLNAPKQLEHPLWLLGPL